MDTFVRWPFLALLPAALLLALGARSQRRVTVVAGALWLLYCLYEYGMTARILCSGECNIRVDLLAGECKPEYRADTEFALHCHRARSPRAI